VIARDSRSSQKIPQSVPPAVVSGSGRVVFGSHWTDPKLIAEVAFIEWASDRHDSTKVKPAVSL